jgi:hypothetical protein
MSSTHNRIEHLVQHRLDTKRSLGYHWAKRHSTVSRNLFPTWYLMVNQMQSDSRSLLNKIKKKTNFQTYSSWLTIPEFGLIMTPFPDEQLDLKSIETTWVKALTPLWEMSLFKYQLAWCYLLVKAHLCQFVRNGDNSRSLFSQWVWCVETLRKARVQPCYLFPLAQCNPLLIKWKTILFLHSNRTR